MVPTALAMTVLNHPLHVLLVGMVLFQGVRAAVSAVTEVRPTRRRSSGSRPNPFAGKCPLAAA